MAIRYEFMNLVIPIQTIDKYYPGGFKEYHSKHKSSFGTRCWYDEHLFRDGAMNGMDIEDLIKRWQRFGLVLLAERDGKKMFKDMCVFDYFTDLNDVCDWLEYGTDPFSIYYRGRPEGAAIGRHEVNVAREKRAPSPVLVEEINYIFGVGKNCPTFITNNMAEKFGLEIGSRLRCMHCGREREITEEWIEEICLKYFGRRYPSKPYYRLNYADIPKFRCVVCHRKTIEYIAQDVDWLRI